MDTDLRSVLGERAAYGVWSTLRDPVGVALLAADGLDYVVFDLQHGSADEADLPALTTAARVEGLVPMARVRAPEPTFVSRALDLGAHGVVVPHVDSAAVATRVVDACRSAPAGHRSFGRVTGGADEPLCVVMIESATGVAAVSEIVAVDGVDAVYVGPWDLALTLGCRPDMADPVLSRAVEAVWSACAAAGRPVGTHALDGRTAAAYAAAGCRLVTVGTDAAWLRAAAHANAAAAGVVRPRG
ncbi:MAG TPA: aldolase/citrate lyase family protein [Mycobacteriales bacterium]|nr:aldolase/citrate lyase family protein [Mycobacteriales bacterium]